MRLELDWRAMADNAPPTLWRTIAAISHGMNFSTLAFRFQHREKGKEVTILVNHRGVIKEFFSP